MLLNTLPITNQEPTEQVLHPAFGHDHRAKNLFGWLLGTGLQQGTRSTQAIALHTGSEMLHHLWHRQPTRTVV